MYGCDDTPGNIVGTENYLLFKLRARYYPGNIVSSRNRWCYAGASRRRAFSGKIQYGICVLYHYSRRYRGARYDLKDPIPQSLGCRAQFSDIGSASVIASILLIILSVKTGVREGISLPLILHSATVVSLMAFFIRRQRTSENPILQLSFFRYRTIVAGIILALASMVSL